MKEKLNLLKSKALQEISSANSFEKIENLRIRLLGRKSGELTLLFQGLPKLPLQERKEAGQLANEIKKSLEQALLEKENYLKKGGGKVSKNWLDVTAPAILPPIGHTHPLTRVINEAKDIFRYLGFTSVDGPEAELDEYNFQKLLLHKDHPARDVQSTYYISEEVLLRTQTSPMQIRYMERHKPPIRIISPGRVYRRDAIDATHLPGFFQMEGLLVDDQTSLTHLIGVLTFFCKRLFGENVKTRVYGHHFPYTEPSIEMEVYHEKSKKWLEILGAGMVHPNVLRNVDIDPEVYRGWAFGMGPDRLAMIRYGIDDIRHFYNGDLRFLEQF
ncbi:MAG: phenylalanine--tRNA ligase subunit alpha [Patescibacteria group bacterium]|nr:phenylalanine--tRNA ligase subunit alpha [Patescibacteria group bacterium]